MSNIMRLLSSKTSSVNLNTYAITRLAENEKRIDEFESQFNEYLENPIELAGVEKLMCPDIAVAGMRSKNFKTKAPRTIIMLRDLTSLSSFFTLTNRKYFRVAYLRVVWIPCATELPGQVTIAFNDMRARQGEEVVERVVMRACSMHRFTYTQDVFIHKSEYDNFGVTVELSGYESKYPNGGSLGSLKVFWIIQQSNNITQFQSLNPIAEEIKKMKMPSVQNVMLNHLNTAIDNNRVETLRESSAKIVDLEDLPESSEKRYDELDEDGLRRRLMKEMKERELEKKMKDIECDSINDLINFNLLTVKKLKEKGVVVRIDEQRKSFDFK